MRALFSLLCLLIAPAAAFAQASPSAEIVALRDQFEAAFLQAERAYPDDEEGLRQIAARIGEDTYGQNWEAVRAEAARSLAALPEIDLARYEGKESARPWADLSAEERRVWLVMSPGVLAGMRFYDAQQVGMFAASSLGLPHMMRESDVSAARLGALMAFAPTRVYRGRYEGRDVLAVRLQRVFVITPFAQHPRGMLIPDLAGVRIFALE